MISRSGRKRLLIFLVAVVAAVAVAFGLDRLRLNGRQSAEITNAAPLQWVSRWNPKIGLWRQDHPGHTWPVVDARSVHPAPSAAGRLLLAAQARSLASIDVMSVLGAIRQMQTLDGGSNHGCLRWYWEEPQPVDTNASFFAGVSLTVLARCYDDQLTEPQRKALRQILTDLRVFFVTKVADRGFHYPNRYLGDLVCAWLIGETLGGQNGNDETLRQTTLDATAYWKKYGWGWGEHLSDIYGAICLDELSVVLLLSEHLPSDVERAFKTLFDDLVALEDGFDALPRVPAMRSYAFADAPVHVGYRQWVRPLAQDREAAMPPLSTPVMPPELGGVFQHRPPLGATLYEHGWHKLAPPRQPPTPDFQIPCFDGAVATARIEKDIRIGSTSRFPIMPSAERLRWGLSWQCFPVAFWRPQGDWGFLQWETCTGDAVRAHPASDLHSAYHNNTLADGVSRPIVGRTYTLQRGGDLLVLRVMPALATDWDRLTDRFRVIDAHATPIAEPAADGRTQLLLRYPEREMSVTCLPISPGANVGVIRDGDASSTGKFDFAATYNRTELEKLNSVILIWGISIDGRVDSAPVLKRFTPAKDVPRAQAEDPIDLEWKWPNTHWRVRIDPLDDQPLRDLGAVQH